MLSKSLIPMAISFIIAFITTPIARKMAFKFGAVDIPKDDRRVHKEPIPYLGGVAIYLGVLIGILIFLPLGDKRTMSILLGGTIIMISGLVDDFIDISPKAKLIVQVIAGIILIFGGVRIEFITYPFSSDRGIIEFPYWLSIIATVFWTTGVTNTVNLIDGLDGLAAGVSAISSLSLMLVAYKLGYDEIIIISAILAGACLGFLPFNFNPAKIFMGDAGALFLGFMLGAISIEGVMKSAATIALIVPLLILGIPIFDTTFAIFRRLLKGQHPMQADKGHLHHRLLRRGYSQKKTVLILYSISIFFGVTAVSIVKVNSKQSVQLSIVLFLVATIFAFLVGRFENGENNRNEI